MEDFLNGFYVTFIEKNRYTLFLTGAKNTITIAFFATLIGILIGVFIAIITVTAKNNKKLKFLSILCNLYTTIIRGTPLVVQLLIMYFIIMSNVESSIIIAIITFGANSGAYVSEIVRAGLLSVDKGQMEAGLSLGLGSKKTMLFIVMPQALKNILPALGNEFITLLKETAVAGYVPIIDLTKAGDITRSVTFQPFFSLFSVAAMYLSMVIVMSSLLKILERRLSKSDRD